MEDPKSQIRSHIPCHFDETHLNTEFSSYLDSVCSVEKQNKLSKNYEKFVAVPYQNKKL